MSLGITEPEPVTGSFEERADRDNRVSSAKKLALAVAAAAQLLVVLDGTIVNVALPSLQSDLDISVAERSYVVTLYALAFGGLLLLGGRVSDFIGRRRALTVGLIAFAGASTLGAVAPSATVLFVARFLQGASAALLAPAALSLLAVTFTEPRERARAFAVFGAVSGAGGAVGLLAGGVLTDASWRWCLLVVVPFALLLAVGAQKAFTESRITDGSRRFDIGGAIAATGGLSALVLALTAADENGWGDTTTIVYFAVSVVLLLAFAVLETRRADPLLPPRVVLDRTRGGAFIVQLLVGAALLAVFVFLTFYLQETRGYEALETGFAFLPFAAGIILGAGLYTVLAPRLRPGLQLPAGLLVAAAGLALLTRIGADTAYWSHVLPGLLLVSVGVGLVYGPVANLALVGVADRDSGVASAMVDTTQQVGGAIGTATLNTIFAGAVSGYIADRATGGDVSQALQQAAALQGYEVAFWVGAGMLAVGALAAAILIKVTPQQLADAAERAKHTAP
jgi:EmrB/QacA subfamily drug resistance transporter